MKRIHLKRLSDDGVCTLGYFIVDGMPLCCSLEPPWKDNKNNISCIPEGEYICVPYNSRKYPGVYEITDVPGRSKILIHIGNYPKNTEGCVLTGSSFGKQAIWNSARAMKSFKKYMNYPDKFILMVHKV